MCEQTCNVKVAEVAANVGPHAIPSRLAEVIHQRPDPKRSCDVRHHASRVLPPAAAGAKITVCSLRRA